MASGESRSPSRFARMMSTARMGGGQYTVAFDDAPGPPTAEQSPRSAQTPLKSSRLHGPCPDSRTDDRGCGQPSRRVRPLLQGGHPDRLDVSAQPSEHPVGAGSDDRRRGRGHEHRADVARRDARRPADGRSHPSEARFVGQRAGGAASRPSHRRADAAGAADRRRLAHAAVAARHLARGDPARRRHHAGVAVRRGRTGRDPRRSTTPRS